VSWVRLSRRWRCTADVKISPSKPPLPTEQAAREGAAQISSRGPRSSSDPVPFRVGGEQPRMPPAPNPARTTAAPPANPGLLGDAMRKARLQGCPRTQDIGWPREEPIDHQAEALQLPSAIRTRGDMGLRRGNLARRQRLNSIGARQLGHRAAVQVWNHGLVAPRPPKSGGEQHIPPET